MTKEFLELEKRLGKETYQQVLDMFDRALSESILLANVPFGEGAYDNIRAKFWDFTDPDFHDKDQEVEFKD